MYIMNNMVNKKSLAILLYAKIEWTHPYKYIPVCLVYFRLSMYVKHTVRIHNNNKCLIWLSALCIFLFLIATSPS